MFGRLLRHRRKIELAAVAVVGILAFVALHTLMREIHVRDVKAALRTLGTGQIMLAVALTAASYFLLTLYDVLALRVIGKPLPYRTTAFASLTSYTLSYNLGFALLTGGSMRYRAYTAAGLAPADVLRVIAIAGATFWSGVLAMTGVALLGRSVPFAIGGVTLSPHIGGSIGAAILLAMAIAIVRLGRGRQSLHVLRWEWPRPTWRQALASPVLASFDLAASSAALFVLLPDATLAGFPAFFLAYVVAIIAALLTHVPGGIGVFEAMMVAALPGHDPAGILAALILYRAIYYLLPLLVAAVAIAVAERRRLRKPVSATLGVVQALVHAVAPVFLAVMVFLGGGVLLVSGALPAVAGRMHMLRHILPLPFVEASQIAASLVGTGLLLLAPALYRRLDAAFLATRALLLAGAAFSLAKGFDYEEALILLLMAAILQLARPAFYRRTMLTTALFSPAVVMAIAACIGFSLWIGLLSYRHVDYQNDLWWQFAWRGDASRFLRTSFTVIVALVAIAIVRLFGSARTGSAAGDTDIAASASVLPGAARCDAFLALTGDKRFLRSPDQDAFLMYQAQGSSWIVMGDPVGPRAEWADLLWRSRELADAAQCRLLLYQIGIDVVPLAIDLGLQLVKYGEEARVPLAGFTLEGPRMKSLRNTAHRVLRDGCSFDVVPRADVPALMPQLQRISDDWLAAKGQSEKAFSVGRFDPEYLGHFDIAVVRDASGAVIAFANVLATADRAELSIDLMRHTIPTPPGIMDFLFTQLMEWGRAQGYQWFSLGLAPLSGLEARRLAPVWARLGGIVYRHGDAFYSFEGLRAYKQKFGPVWEPRFIAGARGFGFARSLIDLQTLVSGSRLSAAAKQQEHARAPARPADS